MDDQIRAANVIACVLGAATASGAIAGAGAGIATIVALADFVRNLAGRAPRLHSRIAADLTAALRDHDHLSDSARTLIPQMVQAAALTPAEVMAAARQPAEIVTRMLDKLTDPAHQPPLLHQQFRHVMTPLLTRLLADQALGDSLRPAFDDALALTLRQIGEQVERLAAQFHDTAYRLGVAETLVKELARRYAPGSEGDVAQACLGLEQALTSAAQLQQAGLLPHNSAGQVDAVLTRVNALNAKGQIDAGADALTRALAEARDRIAQQTSGLLRLLDTQITQSRLRNHPQDAAAAVLEKLALDRPVDAFAALMDEQDRWFTVGSDKGLVFDLHVSIHLAQAAHDRATDAPQRSAALNDLGNSLFTLGSRAADTAHLHEAVSAYRAALTERPRDRVPQDWAATQHNLGAALTILATREPGTDALQQAVTAFRAVLEEFTRDRTPLKWAATQNNLGAALSTLSKRNNDTGLMQEAVTAFRSALEERTRDRAPLDWAETQDNLAGAFLALGIADPGTDLLHEAANAFRAALEERVRDRVPLQWAETQSSLALSLHTLATREAGTAHLHDAVAIYRAALEEQTRDRVPLDWADTQSNLAESLHTLATREPGTTHLHDAITAYRAALEEQTRDRVPLDWARTSGNLGEALADLADLTADPALARQAHTHVVEAEALLRSADQHTLADYFASQIPTIQAIITRLT